MRRPVQLEVMRRLVQQLDADVPIARPGTSALSADRYLDPQQYEAELSAIFRRTPLIVAHISQLPQLGSFVTETVAQVPLLVVRDREGTVRAFVNVCRHRGARLVDDAEGCNKAFTCRYHAWSYDLAGQLIHVPHLSVFGGQLDPAQRGLRALPVEVRHGFVWTRLDGRAAVGVDEFLGASLSDDLDGFELSEHHARRVSAHERRANWKLVMDAFAEGYHVKSLHQHSLARFFVDPSLCDDLDPHVRQVGARREIRNAATADPETWDLRALTTVFYNVFPNVVLVVHPDWISQLSLFPVAVDEVRVVHRMLVRRPPEDDALVDRLERSFTLIDTQVFAQEDLSIVESIQAGLGAGVDSQLPLGGMEEGMRLFHRARDRALRDHDGA